MTSDVWRPWDIRGLPGLSTAQNQRTFGNPRLLTQQQLISCSGDSKNLNASDLSGAAQDISDPYYLSKGSPY